MSNQIRGMLLEEALLHLLTRSGYKTVEFTGDDQTLLNGRSGLEVRGRGESHQIDAIADYHINVPFSYPQRLLVEAKCLGNNVGLPIVRNALGVLKDVQEFWVANNDGAPIKKRYHYQYAIFSATKFTKHAQNYGFAQDIYLIQLEESSFIQPIINSIDPFDNPDLGRRNTSVKDLRHAIRKRVQLDNSQLLENLRVPSNTMDLIENYIEAVLAINGAVLAVINNNLVLFLVPAPNIQLNQLRSQYRVRIFWDNTSWYIRDASNGNDLFSFDLPKELFNMYANSGFMQPGRALDMKQEFMSELQLFITDGNVIKIVRLLLDHTWIENIRAGMREK